MDKKANEAARVISEFNTLPKEDKVYVISYFVDELKKAYGGNNGASAKREINIPVGIFANDALSSLEAIVKYLKEELKLKFSKIGKLLNRSNKTIWSTYHNAIKKMPSKFGEVSQDILIPVSSLSDRSFSILESVVGLIKGLDYSNHEVALMLHLDDSTIWTVYEKIKKKRGVKS